MRIFTHRYREAMNEQGTLLEILRDEKENHVSTGIWHKLQADMAYNSTGSKEAGSRTSRAGSPLRHG
ncbi:MAG: hypothetical protein VZT48_11730 [Bulleidia sp.]|nr:hypothetical protein [Bulleidia sp.]